MMQIKVDNKDDIMFCVHSSTLLALIQSALNHESSMIKNSNPGTLSNKSGKVRADRYQEMQDNVLKVLDNEKRVHV